MILEEIDRNPALSVRLPKKVEDMKDDFLDVVFLNVEKVNEVINLFNGEVLQPIVFVCLYYGLRCSEVLGIKWDAVDFENDVLDIKRTVVKHNTIVEKERTKTKKSKGSYGLLSEVKELLLKIKAEQKKYKKMFGDKYIDTDYVFTWQDGRMIRPDYVTQRFQRVLELHNYPKMRFHDLRHSSATLLVDSGYTLEEVMKWLGHASIRSTECYVHLKKDNKKDMAKTVEDILSI